jgi:hypothetical protein
MLRQIGGKKCPSCGAYLDPVLAFNNAEKRPRWFFKSGSAMTCEACSEEFKATVPFALPKFVAFLVFQFALVWLYLSLALPFAPRGRPAGAWPWELLQIILILIPFLGWLAIAHVLFSRLFVNIQNVTKSHGVL